jgi:hypothetical protein
MPDARDSRAPARPANATAIVVNTTRSGGLYRACGVVNPVICSANVRRGHPPCRQTNRRMCSRITTGAPPNAVSWTLRW